MVDAAASLQGMTDETLSSRRADLSESVAVSVGSDLATYADVARRGIFSPAQSPIWIENWVAGLRPDFLVATLTRGGQPALSVALEVERKGPLQVAGFMSGRHANGNFAPATAAFAANA